MIASDKVELLQRFLASLPETAATRLAKAVEVDRLSGGKALPHDLILDALRPALRQARPASRTLTPLRLFCRPFEDLLIAAARPEKQKGRIHRSSVKPVWRWLCKTLIPEAAAAYEGCAKSAVLGFHQDDALACASGFWLVASSAILAALSSDADAKVARKELGSDEAVADAREMAHILAAGPEVVEVQTVLPISSVTLDEETLWTLRAIYDRIVEKAPDAAPYVGVIAMRRLAQPWQALKLPLFVSRTTQDTLISSTDMGLVGEAIFCEMEAHLAAIRTTRQPDFDAEMLCRHVASFAEYSKGMVKEVEMRRDGRWGQRLLKARSAVAEAMSGFMERAPREILAALPTQRASYSGGPRAPELSRPLDPDKHRRAMSYAHLIVGTKPYAAAASFGAALKDTCDELVGALGQYNDELLRELRTAEGERHERAQAYFEVVAELTTLLLSPEEGELLRRRGRAAIAPAAA
ncbi:MAG: hypothetical protein KGL26_02555 [Pseudomonadota bacterium]|nr:hypothetical protein [Pseudomonadota bacterium]